MRRQKVRDTTETWRARTLTFLAEFESSPERHEKLKWSLLEKVSGVSKTTLWRDKAIRARYNELVDTYQSTIVNSNARTRRKPFHQLEVALRERDQLRAENSLHLQNYVHIAKRLEERGIDPVPIFSGLTATLGAVAKKSRKSPRR